MNVKLKVECRTSKQFDVRHSNVEHQNILTNIESQNSLTFNSQNCFDIQHSNVKSQNDMNVDCQTVLTFDI